MKETEKAITYFIEVYNRDNDLGAVSKDTNTSDIELKHWLHITTDDSKSMSFKSIADARKVVHVLINTANDIALKYKVNHHYRFEIRRR